MRYVFCHIFPKPWIGDTHLLPADRVEGSGGTSPASSRSTGLRPVPLVARRVLLPSLLRVLSSETAASASASFVKIEIASSSRVSSKIWR